MLNIPILVSGNSETCNRKNFTFWVTEILKLHVTENFVTVIIKIITVIILFLEFWTFTVRNFYRNWSFIQLQFCKIKMEFQKIQLLFNKFKKKFLNFQLQKVEYFDICIWKFWNLQQEKLYVLGNWSFEITCNWKFCYSFVILWRIL